MNRILKRNLYLSHAKKKDISSLFETRKVVDTEKRKNSTTTKPSLTDFSTTTTNYSKPGSSGTWDTKSNTTGLSPSSRFTNKKDLNSLSKPTKKEETKEHSFGGSSSDNWHSVVKDESDNKKSGSSGNWDSAYDKDKPYNNIAPGKGGAYENPYKNETSGLNPSDRFNSKINISSASKPKGSGTVSNTTSEILTSDVPKMKSTLNNGSSVGAKDSTAKPTPETWGKQGSDEFKNNKKEYNKWYYEQNKEKWKQYNDPAFSRQGQVDALNEKKQQDAAKDATSNMYRDRAYAEAGKAQGNYMNNLGKTRVAEVSSSPSTVTGKQEVAAMSSSGTTSRSLSSILSSAFNSILNIGKSLLRLFF